VNANAPRHGRPYGVSLLSRIAQADGRQPTRAVSEREIRDNILANLMRMCATRVGTMPTCSDFGIADVSELVHSFPDAIALMATTLKRSIQAYEPRLQNIQVVHVPSDGAELTLRFEIRASLVGDGNRSPMRFDATLDAAQQVTLR
jgi:type VI secretion system protein